MNNLNKKMSLALKLMTLAVIMNVATGCGSCKDDKDDKKVGEEPKLTISFDPQAIKGTTVLSKIKLNNNGDGEFDPSTASDDLVIVFEKTTLTVDGIDAAVVANGEFEVDGKHKGGTGELVVKVKDLFTEKIESKKSSKEKDFKFTKATELNNDSDYKQAEVTAKLRTKDKDGKSKDLNTAKVTWTKA